MLNCGSTGIGPVKTLTAFKMFTIALIAVISISVAEGFTNYNAKTVGEPWPMPQVYTPTAETLILTQDMFTFYTRGSTCDIMEDAYDRYYKLIFNSGLKKRTANDNVLRFKPQKSNEDAQLDGLYVEVTTPCEKYPSLEMDESYDLKVSAGIGSLKAKSVWGALRGMETFSQLVYQNDKMEYQVNVTTVHDFPRFSWRGVLLDTSRHYLAKETIMQNLDAMAYNKLNVFHWHIVDDQSFPYQSRDFPNLSDKGAYNPYTHIYSQEDIKGIIEYGRKRGIRVVPEFDSPGHSQSWGKGQKDLLTKCYSKGTPSGSFGPIDPTLNTTYKFLDGFMKELTEVFPDKYLHLGGDEVSFSCWKSNPDIAKFMAEHKFGTDYAKLEEYYMQNLLDIVASHNSGYIIWQEVVDNGVKLAPSTVVHVWKGGFEHEMSKVTGKGFRSILSSCWYLNRIAFGSDWVSHYKCDPQNFNGTEKQKQLVIGGELCMWGEFVDSTNVISRTWPRGSAVAERLWSAATVTSAKKATPRLEEHRCRLIRRGLPAEPVNGPGVCEYEYIPPK